MVNKQSSSGSNAIYIAVIAMAAIATGIFFWVRTASAAKDPIALTPEAKAYTRNLKLTDPELKAAESYMKVAVVEVTGKIQNAGDRPLDLVEIFCSFQDAYGQIVLRERKAIVSPKMGGLKPGQTKEFRLPFDTLPESWNQGMPGLVIAGIQFANP